MNGMYLFFTSDVTYAGCLLQGKCCSRRAYDLTSMNARAPPVVSSILLFFSLRLSSSSRWANHSVKTCNHVQLDLVKRLLSKSL